MTDKDYLVFEASTTVLGSGRERRCKSADKRFGVRNVFVHCINDEDAHGLALGLPKIICEPLTNIVEAPATGFSFRNFVTSISKDPRRSKIAISNISKQAMTEKKTRAILRALDIFDSDTGTASAAMEMFIPCIGFSVCCCPTRARVTSSLTRSCERASFASKKRMNLMMKHV